MIKYLHGLWRVISFDRIVRMGPVGALVCIGEVDDAVLLEVEAPSSFQRFCRTGGA